jgi:putative membrane protein
MRQEGPGRPQGPPSAPPDRCAAAAASAPPRTTASSSSSSRTPTCEHLGASHPGTSEGAEPDDGSEPDARFTFANERTFLAWNRTALALLVAGLAIAQPQPPFPGVRFGRHLLAVPLICLGAVVSVAGYLKWRRDQRALRLGRAAAALPAAPASWRCRSAA